MRPAECSVLFRKSDWVTSPPSDDFFTPLVPQLESKGTHSKDEDKTNDMMHHSSLLPRKFSLQGQCRKHNTPYTTVDNMQHTYKLIKITIKLSDKSYFGDVTDKSTQCVSELYSLDSMWDLEGGAWSTAGRRTLRCCSLGF